MCVSFLQKSAGQALFYWSPEKQLRGLLPGPEIGYEMEKCVCVDLCLTCVFFISISVSAVVIPVCVCMCVRVSLWSCVSVLSVPDLKSYGQEQQAPFHCWLKCLLGNSPPPPLTHTHTLSPYHHHHPHQFWWRGHFLVTVATFQPGCCKAACCGAHCSPVDR